jgi:polyhydroxyalkanoate synthesis regulator phasin
VNPRGKASGGGENSVAMKCSEPQEITSVTRRSLVDELLLSGIAVTGGMQEDEFMGRLYDLTKLPSYDGRFETATGDIWKHRVMNTDWDEGWMFTDGRFAIQNAPDEEFLHFLSETLHPLVRRSEEERQELLDLYNRHLRADGWEIAERTKISGRSVYGARRCIATSPAIESARDIAGDISSGYLAQQLDRMQDAIVKDPELAIGTAKEFVESICKAIHRERKTGDEFKDDFPGLVRATIKLLDFLPDHASGDTKTAENLKILLNNLGSIGERLAQLRNPYGTGHGKDPLHKGLEEHHARLAVGVATSLGVFLFEAHQRTRSS